MVSQAVIPLQTGSINNDPTHSSTKNDSWRITKLIKSCISNLAFFFHWFGQITRLSSKHTFIVKDSSPVSKVQETYNNVLQLPLDKFDAKYLVYPQPDKILAISKTTPEMIEARKAFLSDDVLEEVFHLAFQLASSYGGIDPKMISSRTCNKDVKLQLKEQLTSKRCDSHWCRVEGKEVTVRSSSYAPTQIQSLADAVVHIFQFADVRESNNPVGA